MELKNIEFYGTPEGKVMISDHESVREYVQDQKEFTEQMIEHIEKFYPEADEALKKHFEKSAMNKPYYDYLRVHRFIRCNFREYDNTDDIGPKGSFRFEFVACPMRGECRHEGIVCNPRFNAALTPSEHAVMQAYYNGKTTEQIGEMLYISPLTVTKHKQNALSRLKLHSMNEFNNYANDNNLFKK